MIIGIGMDMVEMGRVEKACGRQAFTERVYTEEERRQAGENVPRLAGDFAVKEAVAKALGTGFRGFMPGDIEVLRDGLGRPYVNLYGGAKRRADELGVGSVHVSITNTKEYAAAFAVAEDAAFRKGEQYAVSGNRESDEGDRQTRDPGDGDSFGGADGAGRPGSGGRGGGAGM